VAVVYFDSSALVKLLMSEDGSALADEAWNGCDAALSSRLAYPEVCAALAAARSSGIITTRELRESESDWEQFWGAVRPVELNDDVARSAGRLARTLRLRGSDAVHLASALEVGLDGLVLAVWDRQLHAASLVAGLRVLPASLKD
jgi:predicted nucleic acid-binding protein